MDAPLAVAGSGGWVSTLWRLQRAASCGALWKWTSLTVVQIDNSTLSKLEVSNNDRPDKIINDGQMLGGEIKLKKCGVISN